MTGAQERAWAAQGAALAHLLDSTIGPVRATRLRAILGEEGLSPRAVADAMVEARVRVLHLPERARAQAWLTALHQTGSLLAMALVRHDRVAGDRLFAMLRELAPLRGEGVVGVG